MARTKTKIDTDDRFAIPYFSGINSTVQPTLADKHELTHAENARAPVIGVLEKRQGQQKVGTATTGAVFYTRENYGLAKLKVTDTSRQGVFRISATQTFSNTLTISVFDSVVVIDYQLVVSQTILKFHVYDYITVSEPEFFTRTDDSTIILDGTSFGATIYSLTEADVWQPLTDASAINIIGDTFSTANVEGSLLLVNGKDFNRLLSSDGVTVVDSSEAGSVYNSPRAKKAAYYKGRMYVANYRRNAVQYKTTVLRSSYTLGVIALVNGDVTSSTTIEVTDTKYFYTATGMNQYEVYRGGTKVGSTLTVTTVNETSIVVSGAVTLLSSDEIWISGTFNGAKQYRWVNNPTTVGKDVKQYDTFKLSGGEEDEVTLMEGIGNILMIGNKNALMTWNDYTLENFDLGIGCASLKGSVKLLGTLYFIHYSGIYGTTGTTPVLLSRKIEQYIKGATKAGIESAAAGFKGLSVFFAIGDVTLYNSDGSLWKTLPDVCIEYQIADKNWYVHTNVPANALLNFINSSGTERLLLAHTGTGRSVKEFLVGNTDDGDEIFFRADTIDIQFMDEFEYSVHPHTVVTRLHRGSLMTTMVSVDGESFYEIEGANKKGVSTLKITSRSPDKMQPVSCKELKLSFRDASKQLCRIVQAAVIYTPTTLTSPEE